jgi:microcystin-dependent protein
MATKFTNNASATLATSINNSVTSIVVTAGQGALFPTLSAGDVFFATLVDSSNNLEIIKVTARATDTFTAVRGQDGTLARSYTAGDRVELRPVAAALDTFAQLASNQTMSGNNTLSGNNTHSGNNTFSGTNNFTGVATLASPVMTGTPVAPTAAAGTNTTQLATTAFVLANGVPTGGLVMWSTNTAPNGFLLCDGAAVSRTTYAALFAIVGTTFGAGDNSTTFNVPNYTNRVPYGATLGATGGSADAVVVSHTHTATSSVVDPGHAHTIVDGEVNTRTNPYFNWTGTGGASVGVTGARTNSNTTGITVSTSNSTEGVSGTNANLPPYLGIKFIIKT